MNNLRKHPPQNREVIGLIPAGGQATRIAPLPCSKELFPVGFRPVEGGSLRPKAVCHYLLEKMRLAGAGKAYIILRQGKWDIPAYLEDGLMLDMALAYLMMRLPFGAPYTLDQAYPFVREAMIVFGFPDILFQPQNAFVQLLDRQAETEADVVLGLFPAENPHLMDMVSFDDAGQVRQIVIKPPQTELRYTWIIAVWTPTFTQFMHDYLLAAQAAKKEDKRQEGAPAELFVGHVIQAAIDTGLVVDSLLFSAGHCSDIGTPESLLKAVHDGVVDFRF